MRLRLETSESRKLVSSQDAWRRDRRDRRRYAEGNGERWNLSDPGAGYHCEDPGKNGGTSLQTDKYADRRGSE